MDSYIKTKIYKEIDVTYNGKITAKIDTEHLVNVTVKEWMSVIGQERIEDSYVCDCNTNYGGRCLFPEKYRTIGCNGKGD